MKKLIISLSSALVVLISTTRLLSGCRLYNFTSPRASFSNDKYELDSDGALCDIAPSILDILEIEKPSEMTGKSMIKSMAIK